MESGCIFNSRPAPRCIRDPGSGKVDPQCEKVGGACRLISSTAPQPAPPVSLPPIPQLTNIQSPQLQKQQQKGTNEIVIKTGGPNRLSGPISAYSTTIKEEKGEQRQKSFNFFGDAHFSMEGTCKPCKDIDYKTNMFLNPPGSNDCWDISVLLAETFNKYAKEGKYVDFYIESPFIPLSSTNKNLPSLFDIMNKVSREGYIPKLETIFYNCLFKLSCQYSTLRIHYVDVRLGYKTFTLPEMYTQIQKEKQLQQVVEKDIIDYEALLTNELVGLVIKILVNKITREDRSRDTLIEEINSLMKDLYFSGGQTMAGKIDPKNYKLFELYLTSDDFINDVKKLLDWSQIKTKKLLDKLNNSFSRVKKTDNRVMHRVRAQLYALEKEGKVQLANDIKTFILGEYRKNTEKTMSKIMDIWNSVYLTYNGFVNAKYRSMDDIYKVINAFEKEYVNYMKIFGYTVTGFSLLMDAYLLGRMFREFPAGYSASSSFGFSLKDNKGHVDSSKCIVYAGDAHIENYVKFFTQYLNLSSPMIAYNPNNEFVKKKEFEKITRCLQVDINDFK